MKKFFAMMLVTSMMLAWSASAVSANESDEAVTYGDVLFELGLIQGSNGQLHEENELTREEMIAILNRLNVDADEKFTPPAKPTFSDVPKTHWAYADVEKAYYNGLTTGLGNGKFGIGGKITYQQAVTFLARTAGYNINYEHALEEGAELGIVLVEGRTKETNLFRADVFELMVNTLMTEVEGTDLVLIVLLPGMTEEKLDQFVMSSLEAVNPMAYVLNYRVLPDNYKGNDAFLAEASDGQHANSLEVAKVVDLFKGTGEEADYSEFFSAAAGGQEEFGFTYGWSTYSNDPEYGEYAITGETYTSMNKAGEIASHVWATEGETDYIGEDPIILKHDPIKLGNKTYSAYHVIAYVPTFEENEWFREEMFFLIDDAGVYQSAVVGYLGDGVYTRE